MKIIVTMDGTHAFAQGLIAEGWLNDDPNCVDTLHRRLEAFAAKSNAIASMQTTTAFSCPECCAKQGQPHEPTCPTLQAPAGPAIGSWHTGLPLPDAEAEPVAPAPLIYPPELTPALAHILGFPNFRTGQIAHVFQEAGFKIATKCEDEQAFVLDRLIRAVLTHGEGWADAFSADLRDQQRTINEKKKASGAES